MGENVAAGTLYRNVAVDEILAFFDDENGGYPLCDSNEYFHNATISHYVKVKHRRGELHEWNVLFRRLKDADTSDVLDGDVATLVTRSRLTTGIDETTIGIGTLTDRDDGIADVPDTFRGQPETYRDRSGKPLLVVYVIDKDSRAKNRRRSDLNAVDHLIGLALFLPVSKHVDDLGDFAVVRGPWDSKPDDEDVPEPDVDDDSEGDAPDIVPTGI